MSLVRSLGARRGNMLCFLVNVSSVPVSCYVLLRNSGECDIICGHGEIRVKTGSGWSLVW